MNTDNDFRIGNDHLVCQDYSTVGCRDSIAYAILSDGCSASPDVDIGARMLTLSAKRALVLSDWVDYDYDKFGDICIHNASGAFDLFPQLHPQSLDATLAVTWVKENNLTAYIYGDGVFFHKSASGVYASKVSLTSGAPDYLSYNLDPARKEQYLKVFKGETKVVETIGGENGMVSLSCEPFSPVVINRKVSPGDIVAVSSDGINSFRKLDNTPLPWTDMIEEFIGYKNFSGVFVKRRMIALKKKCVKEGWVHGDDISVAAIFI